MTISRVEDRFPLPRLTGVITSGQPAPLIISAPYSRGGTETKRLPRS